MFNVGDKLYYEAGGIYVEVIEVHEGHMAIKDLDTDWDLTIYTAEYDEYTLVEDEEA